MTNIVRDGGYYAIKGFAFQFDKTIMQILDQTDLSAEVTIEQIQDLTDTRFIVQVKYKEASDYAPSKINAAVKLLITDFDAVRKKPILYAHFANKGQETVTLTIEELNAILSSDASSFDNNLKQDFVNQFEIHFAKGFSDQFENLILKIKSEFSCEEEQALFFHAQICKFLESRVTGNPSASISNRKTTKAEVIEKMKSITKSVFFSSYQSFLGEERYFSMLRKQFFQERNINDHERFFVIEVRDEDTLENLYEVVCRIKEKFYKKMIRMQKSYAPYIYLRGCPDTLLKSLKAKLFEEGFIINDGYPFKGAKFYESFLIERKPAVHLKFIDQESNVPSTIESAVKPRRIFQFYITSPIDIGVQYQTVSMSIKSLDDILNIILV